MARYYDVRLDDGQGGETTIEAESVQEALNWAFQWVKEGDWGAGGGTVKVLVRDQADPFDLLIEYVDIPGRLLTTK